MALLCPPDVMLYGCTSAALTLLRLAHGGIRCGWLYDLAGISQAQHPSVETNVA
jgi:hypothetical protein